MPRQGRSSGSPMLWVALVTFLLMPTSKRSAIAGARHRTGTRWTRHRPVRLDDDVGALIGLAFQNGDMAAAPRARWVIRTGSDSFVSHGWPSPQIGQNQVAVAS